MAGLVFEEHLGGQVGKEATAVHMVDLPLGVLCSGKESVFLLPAFTLKCREKGGLV